MKAYRGFESPSLRQILFRAGSTAFGSLTGSPCTQGVTGFFSSIGLWEFVAIWNDGVVVAVANGLATRNHAANILLGDILVSYKKQNYARLDVNELPALLRQI